VFFEWSKPESSQVSVHISESEDEEEEEEDDDDEDEGKILYYKVFFLTSYLTVFG
jgi:hypothetical protein